MRILVLAAALAASLPVGAFAQGLARTAVRDERILATRFTGAAAGVGQRVGNYVASSDSNIEVTRLTVDVGSASGGGGSNTVFSVGDGTNTCTFTLTCVSSQATGAKSLTPTGTCLFAPGATLLFQVVSSGCSTTQPTLYGIEFWGRRSY